MIRHKRAAGRRGDGFSLVELLVSIVIATVAFGALVPLFVMGQQKGAGDSARDQALSLARDRIEKIRELDYDQIYEDNLNSPTWFGGEFGHSAPVANGGGTKTYTVDYSVVFVGGASYAGNGQHDVSASSAATYGNGEKYKQVTVTVYWTGNPQPVKQVVLSTSIYRQYQGSRIDKLVVEGLHGNVDSADVNRQFVTSTPVTTTAYVNEADASRTSKVTFYLYNTSGLVATLTCLASNSANGVYHVQWDPGVAAGSLDGLYTVKATASNTYGYAVNTFTTTFSLETGSPPTVSGATAFGYNHAINLAWGNTTAGDVVKYYVTRMDPPTPTSNAPAYSATPTYTILFSTDVAPTVADTGLDAKGFANNDYVAPGDSRYLVYYRIVAVDSVGNVSDPVVVSAIPHLAGDSTAPTTPSAFAGGVTSSGSPPLWVTLTWGFSTDPTVSGQVASGVNGYRVYRKAGTGAWTLVTTVPHVADTVTHPTYSWTDASVKPLVQYQYYVTAVDNVYNESAPTATLTFTTPNYLYNNVLVQNTDKSSTYNMTVTNPDGSAVDTWPWPNGSWTTTPITASLSGANSHSSHYLPVGLMFKVNYQKTGSTTWQSKLVTVTTTTTVTINGATYAEVDIP